MVDLMKQQHKCPCNGKHDLLYTIMVFGGLFIFFLTFVVIELSTDCVKTDVLDAVCQEVEDNSFYHEEEVGVSSEFICVKEEYNWEIRSTRDIVITE